jgi:hypothetical protein
LRPDMAQAVFFYAVLLTAIHLPLTMNTRLRSPLFDPLLASLSAGAVVQYLHHTFGSCRTRITTAGSGCPTEGSLLWF